MCTLLILTSDMRFPAGSSVSQDAQGIVAWMVAEGDLSARGAGHRSRRCVVELDSGHGSKRTRHRLVSSAQQRQGLGPPRIEVPGVCPTRTPRPLGWPRKPTHRPGLRGHGRFFLVTILPLRDCSSGRCPPAARGSAERHRPRRPSLADSPWFAPVAPCPPTRPLTERLRDRSHGRPRSIVGHGAARRGARFVVTDRFVRTVATGYPELRPPSRAGA